jgi:heme/copper-type cytochrome/quinol oxidase subunit 2
MTETLINDANEKIKSLCDEVSLLRSENKKLWYCIYILICVSIVFGIILLYFIFKFKNNFEHKKDNISPSMTLIH